MTIHRFSHPVLGNYIGGRFRRPDDPFGAWEAKSPANFEDEIGRFEYSYSDIDRAILAARDGFKEWSRIPLEGRVNCIQKHAEALQKHRNGIIEAMAREVGKPLWESERELDFTIGSVNVAINEARRILSKNRPTEVFRGTVGYSEFRPLGVIAVIGPFNQPVCFPDVSTVAALLGGNSVVFKPSEKAPMTGQLLALSYEEAGLPPGTFNLIQGEQEVGRRLCVHESINGIFFTGSFETGSRIKQDTLQQQWKQLSLAMSGKNSAIVWDDADLGASVRDVLVGAFITAGQRCTATDTVFVHTKVFDQFVSELHKKAKSFSIGYPFDNPFMGPLISQTTVDRYMKFIGIAMREGCEVIMRGKTLDLKATGYYVSPSICTSIAQTPETVRKSVFRQTEIFAPCVLVVQVSEIEDAIAQANSVPYGLVGSVFSRSRAVFDRCTAGLECGWINWNKPTTDILPMFPFGGIKKSGNFHSAGASAIRNAVYPVTIIETENPLCGTEEVLGL